MTDRYDICSPRKDREGKTRWTKIGAMFPAKSGEGFAIKLDALPLPDAEGNVWLSAFVPQPREDTPAREPQPKTYPVKASKPAAQAASIDDDAIPF